MVRTSKILPVVLAISLAACGVPPNPEENTTADTGAAAEPDVPAATASDPTSASAAAEPLVIAARGFDGVMIGVAFDEVADRLTLDEAAAADGLDAYGITDEAGMRTGTVYVDDAETVARIAVTNTEAETLDNLGVGSTYADLQNAYGGELEMGEPSADGRAVVMGGGLTWHLAANDAAAPKGSDEVVAVVVD